MATFNGRIAEPGIQVPDGTLKTRIGSLSQHDVAILPDAPGFGSKIAEGWASSGASLAGLKIKCFEDELLYHRLWLTPSVIEIPLILAAVATKLRFWNAYLDRPVVLSDMNATGDATGVSMTDPLLPINIPTNGFRELEITVTTQGATSLDVLFDLIHNADPQIVTIHVSGLRAMYLPIYHNWASDYQITYALSTVVSSTRRLHEQRKPIHSRVRREVSLEALSFDSARLQNILQMSANRVFMVPFETEPMHPVGTGSILNLATLPITETLTQYFNLARATHAVIRHFPTGGGFLAPIASYAANSLTFDSPITEDWKASDVCIYPVMPGTMTAFASTLITNRVGTAPLTCLEYFINGQ